MPSDQGAPPAHYDIGRREPLLVLAVTDASDLDALRRQLLAAFPGRRFIGVVTAGDGDDVGRLLEGLGPLLAELIFTASGSRQSAAGDTLATLALTELGVGQDFVFTVERLDDAIRYAIRELDVERRGRWEGTAILVVGSDRTIREARDILAVVADEGPPAR